MNNNETIAESRARVARRWHLPILRMRDWRLELLSASFVFTLFYYTLSFLIPQAAFWLGAPWWVNFVVKLLLRGRYGIVGSVVFVYLSHRYLLPCDR